MKPSSSHHGFLILEVLIALAIFSIAIIGLGHLQNKTLQRLTDNRSHMTAMILLQDAQDRIELNAPNANSYMGSKIGSTQLNAGSSIASQDLSEMSRTLQSFNQVMDISQSGKIITVSVYSLEDEANVSNNSISFELYQHLTKEE